MALGSFLTKDKTLFAGFVDGINVWKTDIKKTNTNLNYLSKIVDEI